MAPPVAVAVGGIYILLTVNYKFSCGFRGSFQSAYVQN